MSEEFEKEGLIDVSNIDLARLLTEVDESGLERAVSHILTSGPDNVCRSFSRSV